MKSAFVFISIIGFIVGLMIGPGYLIYVNLWSGTSVVTFPIFKGESVGVNLGSSQQIVTTGTWNRTFDLALTPDMNPIRVTATA